MFPTLVTQESQERGPVLKVNSRKTGAFSEWRGLSIFELMEKKLTEVGDMPVHLQEPSLAVFTCSRWDEGDPQGSPSPVWRAQSQSPQ